MKNTIFAILLLPFTLFAQNNLSVFQGIEKSEVAVNSTFSVPAKLQSEVKTNPVFYENGVPFEAVKTDLIQDIKNALPTADLLNFCFDCGYIKWSTASETNCSHFLIMFSRDNKSWNILGQIYGAGNSSAMNNYKYPTDLFDVYFKIYQMDFNGSSKEYGPIYGSCKKPRKT